MKLVISATIGLFLLTSISTFAAGGEDKGGANRGGQGGGRLVQERRKTVDADIGGPNGIGKSCKNDIAEFCKAENKANLKAERKGKNKLEPRVNLFSCLQSNSSQLEPVCKDKVASSPQAQRLTVKKACMAELTDGVCKGAAKKSRNNEEEAAATPGSGNYGGAAMECLINKKVGITNATCTAAITSYQAWLKMGQPNIAQGQTNMNQAVQTSQVRITDTAPAPASLVDTAK